MTELLPPARVPELPAERVAAMRDALVREATTAARPPRWRRPALGAALAAAAGLAAVLVADPLGHDTRLVRPALPPTVDEASAMERLARQVTDGRAIVHVVAVYTVGSGATLRTETWAAADGRLRVRQSFGDGTVFELRLDHAGLTSVDAARGVVVDHPWRSADEAARRRRELDVFDVQPFLRAVRDGAVRQIAAGTFEGRTVDRYRAVDGADVYTWFVEPTTGRPVAQRETVQGEPGVGGTVRYERFETLAPDDALLELDAPPGAKTEVDAPTAWAPLSAGDPAPALAAAAFARTADRPDAPRSLPRGDLARVALVVPLGTDAQFAIVTAPRTGGGQPCYVLLQHDREGDIGSGEGVCPPHAPALNASREGRWWTIGGVLEPGVARVELRMGVRVVPLRPRGRLLAVVIPAGAPEEAVRLVVHDVDGGTHVGPPVRLRAEGGAH